MRIRLAIPDHLVSPETVEPVLEGVTRANQLLIRSGAAPDAMELLQRGKRWQKEPYKDGEHFDLIPEIERRGWGDCDDWGPAMTATLRESGEDPHAKTTLRRSGAKRWHVVSEASDGTIVDPSVWAGMPSKRLPIARPIWPEGISGAIVCPLKGRHWAARCDLPIEGGHIVGVAMDCTSARTALARAISGVSLCHADGENICGIIDEDILGEVILDGDENIIGQFDFLAKAAGGALGGALGSILPGGGGGGAAPGGGAGGFTPGGGGGAPAQQQAAPGPSHGGVTSHVLPSGATMSYGPGAPIIIRF